MSGGEGLIEEIEWARLSLGMTLLELERLSGVSRVQYHRLRKNQWIGRLDTYQKLGAVFGLTLSFAATPDTPTEQESK